MSANENRSIHNFQPVMAAGNLVPNFDPLKLLVSTPAGPKLDLPYKKLWFHKKYLNGRIKISPLRITDQFAIIEASVFFDRNDPEPATSYIAEKKKDEVPRGRYIEAAQDTAIEQALSNAGFDIQFMPVRQSNQTGENAKAAQPPKPASKPASVKAGVSPKTAAPSQEEKQAASAIAVEKPAAPAETPAPAVPEELPKQDAAPVSPLSVVKETAAGSPVQEAPLQADDFEEILWEETAQDTPMAPAVPAAPAYTSDTPVDTILSVMTLEEARDYVVKEGACSGWTLAQVEERRPASLKFYVSGYSGKDNILRAGAKLLLSDTQRKAG